jgi:hypothetical protein
VLADERVVTGDGDGNHETHAALVPRSELELDRAIEQRDRLAITCLARLARPGPDTPLAGLLRGALRRVRHGHELKTHRRVDATGHLELRDSRLEREDLDSFEGILRFEKRRARLERTREVEAPDLDDVTDRDVRAGRPVHARHRVHRPDALLDRAQRLGRHEIRLVEHDGVGERDLLAALVGVVEVELHVLCVDHRDDPVEAELLAHVVVDEEGLGNRARIGQPRRLDEHVIELVSTPDQAPEDANQVAAHGAADAPVVHLEDFLVRTDDQRVVDADLAELVLDDGNSLAVLLGEDAVEQGRLPRAEKAGEHGDGNA